VDKRVVRFRIGVMILATLVITVIVTLYFGQGLSFSRLFGLDHSYTIYIDFPDAAGVTMRTNVFKRGVPIGRVTDLTLKDEDAVRVTVKIDGDRKINSDEVARLTRSLMTNDGQIEITRMARAQTAPAREPIGPGGVIQGQVAPDVMQAMGSFQRDLDRAIDSVTRTSDKFGQLIDKVNLALGTPDELAAQKQRFGAVLEKTNTTLDAINNAANTFNDIVANPGIKQAMDDLPKAIDDTRKTLRQISNAIDLADRNLQNLDAFTQALRQQATKGRID
jgi:ABC-type transporter Mla subunit MlaD